MKPRFVPQGTERFVNVGPDALLPIQLKQIAQFDGILVLLLSRTYFPKHDDSFTIFNYPAAKGKFKAIHIFNEEEGVFRPENYVRVHRPSGVRPPPVQFTFLRAYEGSVVAGLDRPAVRFDVEPTYNLTNLVVRFQVTLSLARLQHTHTHTPARTHTHIHHIVMNIDTELRSGRLRGGGRLRRRRAPTSTTASSASTLCLLSSFIGLLQASSIGPASSPWRCGKKVCHA